MQISTQRKTSQAVTILTGQVNDQGDLMGVLDMLYQMRMNVLSVTCKLGVELETTFNPYSSFDPPSFGTRFAPNP